MIAAAILLGSLALDTFAVALGLGLSGLPRTKWRQVGFTFACFEGGMPVVGLLVGQRLSALIGGWTGYIAASLLILVGVLAIKEALSVKEEEDEDETPSMEGRRLLLTGLSVSLDELAVGFSLGVLHTSIGPTLAYIAIQAFVITFAGLTLGARLGRRLEDRAELVSGIVLTLLGIAILVNQATGSHFL